jgi:subtilase family serine protease
MNNSQIPLVPTVHRVLAGTVAVALTVCAIAFVSSGSPASAAPAPGWYATAMVRLAHPSGLQKFAKAVSSPNSRRYQQYRPVAWIVKRFGASPKTKSRAIEWFESRGMSAEVDGAGQNLLVDMTAEQAKRFLEPGASVASVRDGGPATVPAGISDIVTGISFLDSDPEKFQTLGKYPPQPSGSPFPANSSMRPHSGTQSGCAAGRRGMIALPEEFRNFTPNQWLDAYGISTLHRQGFKGQGMRIAVIETDGFRRSDIETYGKCYGKRVPPTPITRVGIKKALAPGDETTLDLEVLTAVAPRLKSIDVYQGHGSEAGLMRQVGRALGGPRSKPDAISISLGMCEPWLFAQMQYRRGMDNLFAVAAGAGISVFAAAGDTGSAGCSLDGNSGALPLLAVNDPASSQWVTAVGGTNLVLDARNRIRQEFTWNEGSKGVSGGGGGLSILATSRPWYQQGTKGFRALGLTRALPDIAALADFMPGYSVYCTAEGSCTSKDLPEGGWQPIGGTSAATPLMAGLVTLVSQKLRKQGRKPIGFANPLFYKLGKSRARHSVFRDIVAGNNDTGAAIPPAQGGTGPLGCCDTDKGFDLASGWGSVKATGLAKAAARHARKN